MQITIDTSDSLEQVVCVIQAAYDVGLTVTDHDDATRPGTGAATGQKGRPPTRAAAHGRRSRTTSKKKANARAGRRRGSATTAEIREWARGNGHAVSGTGRISAAVIAAYRQAH